MHQRSADVTQGEIQRQHTHAQENAYPELATLFSDHFPVLYHVDRTLVDRVVCFVSQPVLITLIKRARERKSERDVVKSRYSLRPLKQAGGSHLFDGGDRDDEEERQSAGDRTGGGVDDQLQREVNKHKRRELKPLQEKKKKREESLSINI